MIYDRVLDNGKSFFTNDPQSHLDSISLPEPFLSVPLVQEEKIIGLIAVVNQEGGYNFEQQEDLEAISPAVMRALKRKKAEDALEKIESAHKKEIHHRIKTIFR